MMYFWCCTRQKALSVKSDKVLNIYICVICICLEFRISNYRITAYATISYHQSSVFCLLSAVCYLLSRVLCLSSVNCPQPLYICRELSTNQLLFMQNKPNSPNVQMNVSNVKTMNYKNLFPRRGTKTNSKQTQSNPISEKPK